MGMGSRPHRIIAFACVAAALLGAVGALRPATAAPDEGASVEKARADAVARLESLMTWCDGQRVQGYRDRVAARVLVLSPDHARARSVLKYKRTSKGGPWVQAADYKEPPDWNKGSLAEAETRLAAATTGYRDAVLAAAADPDVPTGRREESLERLVDLLPDDAELRRKRGDVQRGGRWVLPETADGERVRAGRRDAARAALVKARRSVRDDLDTLAIGWMTAIESPRRKVYGGVPRTDAVEALVAMDAGDALCAAIFGSASGEVVGPKSTILLSTREQARRVIEEDPKDASVLAILDHVSGTVLPSGPYLSFSSDPVLRRLGGIRQVVLAHLLGRFPKAEDRGWVIEGMGQRIVWSTLGEHGPAFIEFGHTDRGEGREDGGEFLPSRAAAWPAAAAAVLSRDGPRRLSAVLTMRLNAMRATDVLVAYGLSAYLLEGRPESLVPFLDATGAQDDPEALVGETLGADVAALAWRVRRFCLEAR